MLADLRRCLRDGKRLWDLSCRQTTRLIRQNVLMVQTASKEKMKPLAETALMNKQTRHQQKQQQQKQKRTRTTKTTTKTKKNASARREQGGSLALAW